MRENRGGDIAAGRATRAVHRGFLFAPEKNEDETLEIVKHRIEI